MATRPDAMGIRAASPGLAMLERLRAGTDNRRRCRWPGSAGDDGAFWLVPLLCAELQDAYAAANKRWQDLGLAVNLHTADDFYSELSMQILARAMRTIDDPKARLFDSADELREVISPDERSAIASEYIALQEEADPDPADMSAEVVEQIDDAIKKKDVARLSAFSSLTLAAYLIGTASQSAS